MEWLGNCWHQSSTRTCSGPEAVSPSAVSRDSRPLTTQPSVVGPGGLGQPSEVAPAVRREMRRRAREGSAAFSGAGERDGPDDAGGPAGQTPGENLDRAKEQP